MKTNWPTLRHGYLILAGAALASSPLLAQTPSAGARCGDLGGHLQRCHYASAGTVGGSRGR